MSNTKQQLKSTDSVVVPQTIDGIAKALYGERVKVKNTLISIPWELLYGHNRDSYRAMARLVQRWLRLGKR